MRWFFYKNYAEHHGIASLFKDLSYFGKRKIAPRTLSVFDHVSFVGIMQNEVT